MTQHRRNSAAEQQGLRAGRRGPRLHQRAGSSCCTSAAATSAGWCSSRAGAGPSTSSRSRARSCARRRTSSTTSPGTLRDPDGRRHRVRRRARPGDRPARRATTPGWSATRPSSSSTGGGPATTPGPERAEAYRRRRMVRRGGNAGGVARRVAGGVASRCPPRRRSPAAARMAGMVSLVTSPGSAVSSSMMANAAAMRSGVSITIVTAGTCRPSWSSRSPCGGVVAVEAPDAAQGGRAADPGRAQPADDGAVDRLAVVQGRLGGVDHELVPQRPCRCSSVPGSAPRAGRAARPSRLQMRTRSSVSSGPAQQPAELGQDPADPLARADRDDHHRRPRRCG